MSIFRRDLDEYSWKELRDELERRLRNNAKGLCHYCGGLFASSPCRFPDAHRYVSWTMKDIGNERQSSEAETKQEI